MGIVRVNEYVGYEMSKFNGLLFSCVGVDTCSSL